MAIGTPAPRPGETLVLPERDYLYGVGPIVAVVLTVTARIEYDGKPWWPPHPEQGRTRAHALDWARTTFRFLVATAPRAVALPRSREPYLSVCGRRVPPRAARPITKTARA